MARLPLPPAEAMKLVPLAEIARGGMGSVELARAEGGKFNGQLLAIKRLHPNIAQDPQFVGMFLDEAWMTAALKSPNVVQVAAWGNDEKGMFLAVEFVQGVSLSRLIKESKANKEPFAERTCAYLGSQICAGLSAAHGLRGPDQALLGLVHRDLTPGNILVGFDGVVKIADFGIAKAEERITHTRTGTLKGKPSYMAPEQARGGKVDLRADLFSFGVLFFELLAGRRPWLAKSAFDVMMEIATNPPANLRELRNVNPVFIGIVEKCLSKKSEGRYSSAAEIQQELDAWRQQRGFVHDDQQSFAQFVVRNSAEQTKWFADAMRGELQKKAEAVSFKELEERIDAERETSSSSRRSGARSGDDPASSAHPSARGSAAELLPAPSKMKRGYVAPGAPPSQPVSSMPYGQQPPSSPRAGSGSYGAVAPMSQPMSQPMSRDSQIRQSGVTPSPDMQGYRPQPTPQRPSTPGYGPEGPASPQRQFGGTEYMAQSPFAAQQQGPPPSVAGTVMMTSSPAQASSSPPSPRSQSKRTVPMQAVDPPLSPQTSPRPSQLDPLAQRASGMHQLPAAPSLAIAPAAKKKSGAAWIFVLLVIVAVGALGWFFRGSLMSHGFPG